MFRVRVYEKLKLDADVRSGDEPHGLPATDTRVNSGQRGEEGAVATVGIAIGLPDFQKLYRYTGWMRLSALIMLLLFVTGPVAWGQTKKATPKKTTPAGKKAPPRKAPAPAAPVRMQARLACPSELGIGVKTTRHFCDVLAGREFKEGVIVTIPPHRGPVLLSFELHNRHTYSEDLVKAKTAYRKYTATVGVLTMDNTLIDRAVIQSEFRSDADLFDRIRGGAAPGGVKAVAPSGTEFITIELPENVGEEVSILGEKLTVVRPRGIDNFVSAGRPVATISNVIVEYRPGPPPKKTPAKKP